MSRKIMLGNGCKPKLSLKESYYMILHETVPNIPSSVNARKFAEGGWETVLSKNTMSVLVADYREGAYPQVREALYQELCSIVKDVHPKKVTSKLRVASSKWFAMSVMQKAVRRGNFPMAYRMAMALANSGMAHLAFRRLAVIALEDVGLGNPILALIVMIVNNHAHFRALDNSKLLHWLLARLCESVKSRDLCDLVVYAFLDDTMHEEMEGLVDKGGNHLIDVALDPDTRLTHKMAAIWRMHGGKWGNISEFGNPKEPRATRSVFMERGEYPNYIGLLVERGDLGSKEALAIPVPIVWNYMCASEVVTGAEDYYTIENEATWKGMYLSALDKHTYKGKAALKRYMKKSSKVNSYLDGVGLLDMKKRHDSVERAVFYVEGSVLDNRLVYDRSRDIYYDVLKCKMKDTGIGYDDGLGMYDIVSSELSMLNDERLGLL
jgi:hypothetical protein